MYKETKKSESKHQCPICKFRTECDSNPENFKQKQSPADLEFLFSTLDRFCNQFERGEK